ncbi:MAG: hypothetical protein ACLFVG_10675 [Candidatus Aminicenantes bacterium]
MMKYPLLILAAIGHQEVEMDVEIDLLREGLDLSYYPWSKLCASGCLEVFEEGIDSRRHESSRDKK